ncbi:MAG: hypothetical protein ACOCXS_03825 [Bacteroidota bacterium]
MLRINLNNYEAWFLDYVEGRLAPEDQEELQAFLAVYPNKRQELELFEGISLSAGEDITFSQKNMLKKDINEGESINEKNFDEYCLGYLEGELSLPKMMEYQEYLAEHPEKKREEDLFRMTFLKPDYAVTLPGKHLLKKNKTMPMVRRVLAIGMAIAAGLTIYFSLLNIPDISGPANQSGQEIAQQVQTPPNGETEDRQNNPEPVDEKQDTNNTQNTESTPDANVERPAQEENQQPERKSIKNKRPVQSLGTNLIAMNNNPAGDAAGLETVETGVRKVNPRTLTAIEHQSMVEARPIASREQKPVEKVRSQSIQEKYVTLREVALTKVEKRIPAQARELAAKDDRSLIDVAGAGINGLNNLLGKPVAVEREIDREGNLRSLAINTKTFGFYTTRNKEE